MLVRLQEIVLRASEYLLTRCEWFLRREEIRLKSDFNDKKTQCIIWVVENPYLISTKSPPLTLSGPGFEKLAQTGGGRIPPPLLTSLPCIRTKPNLVWANTII